MQETLKLIFKDREFTIPSDVRYLNDINSDVHNSLLSTKRYIVKSNVQDETFKSFIKFWVNKEIPSLEANNISDYEQLSQEFGLMEDVISLYKKMSKQNKEDENKLINKYKQITNALFRSDLLRENCLRDQIYEAMRTENIELIEFLTGETIELNGILYMINKKEQTAELVKLETSYDTIKIPASINTFYKKYKVTKIYEEAFARRPRFYTVLFDKNINLFEIQTRAFYHSSIHKIVIPKSVTKISDEVFMNCSVLKEVSFEKNSELKSIGKMCFCCAGLSFLSLPSNFIEFGKEWCSLTMNLEKFVVLPSKQNCISLFENKYLLSKSDSESDIFDILLIASRKIKKAVIPSFIKQIADYAFDQCSHLIEVECSSDSQLKIIGEKAFCCCPIEKITLPSGVERFGNEWCSEVYSLADITVIKQEIENIKYYEDNFIIGKTDLNSDIFDILYFANRSIQDVLIPSFIKIIGSSAFEGCTYLQQVSFPIDTNCVSIERCSFARSSLEKIEIPYQITKIRKGTFQECSDLITIDIPENSKLQKFGRDSLLGIPAMNLHIPSFVNEFKANWCDTANKLVNISLSLENKNFVYFDDQIIIGKSDNSSSVYDVLLFARRNIQYPIIPSFIKRIASSAFNSCYKLRTVLFQSNSQLEAIDEYAFAYTPLERITIPSHVKEIKFYAFDDCEKLTIFEFEENPELESLELSAFHNTNIQSFMFPPHLVNLKLYHLDFFGPQIIEISENSEFKSLPHLMFTSSETIIMVPSNFMNDFYLY